MLTLVCLMIFYGSTLVRGQYAFLEIDRSSKTLTNCTCEHDFLHSGSEIATCSQLMLVRSLHQISQNDCHCATNSSSEIADQAALEANSTSRPWGRLKKLYICCNSLDDDQSAALLYNTLNFAQVERLITIDCHRFTAGQTTYITLYSLRHIAAKIHPLFLAGPASKVFDLELGRGAGKFKQHEDQHVAFLTTDVMKTGSDVVSFSFLASLDDHALTEELAESMRRAPVSVINSPNRTVMFTPIYV